MKRAILLIGFALLAVAADAPVAPEQDIVKQAAKTGTIVVNPGIDRLNEAVRFYLSFEDGVLADMSLGSEKPIIRGKSGKPVFCPGRFGRAWLTGGRNNACSSLTFQCRDNLDFSRPGALSFWVMPVDWYSPKAHDSRPYLHFFSVKGSRHGAFIVERMGFCKKPRRGDALWVGLSAFPGIGTQGLCRYGTLGWKNGEWYLIVINWNKRGIELSINGSAFSRFNWSRPLVPKYFDFTVKKTVFTIGSGPQEEETLIDEFTIYTRVLTVGDAQALFRFLPGNSMAQMANPQKK